MTAARASILCALTAAALATSACSSDEPGIAVSVDLAEFASGTRSLRVAIFASGGGFVEQEPSRVQGVGVTTQDLDGDGKLELVTQFLNPGGSVSFRVATLNGAPLKVRGQAVAFDETKVIAGDDGDPNGADLPAGGRGSIALKLTARAPGIVGPGTRTTDILTENPDTKIGTFAGAHLSAVVLCDVDGDGVQDSSSARPTLSRWASPSAPSSSCAAAASPAEIDLSNPQTAMGFQLLRAPGRRSAGRRRDVRQPERGQRRRSDRRRARSAPPSTPCSGARTSPPARSNREPPAPTSRTSPGREAPGPTSARCCSPATSAATRPPRS